MTRLIWRVAEFLARMLKRDEREAVLGDVVELGISPGEAVLDVVSVVARRSLRAVAKTLRIMTGAIVYAILVLALGYWLDSTSRRPNESTCSGVRCRAG